MTTVVGSRAASPPAAGRRRSPWPALVAVAIVAAAGLAIRVVILRSPLGDLDSDEAIVGLMARRLLDGSFDTFYTGQSFGGSQEAILSAALFAVAGSSVLGLKLVMVALTAMAAVLTWRAGRRVVGEHAAVLAAALLWVGSPFALWWSTKARAFYGMSAVMSLLAVFAVLRLLDHGRRRDALLLGLAVGLGWWANPQTAPIAGAAALAALAVTPRLLRLAPLAVVGGVVGAGPWIIYNVRNQRASLVPPDVPRDAPLSERFTDLFTDALPRYIGIADQLTGAWRLAPLTFVAYVVVGVAVVAWILRAVVARDRRLVLAAPMVAFVVFWAANPSTAFPEPRYLWVVAPLVLLVVADLAVRLAARAGRSSLAFALVPVVAVASAVGVGDLIDDTRPLRGNWDVVPGDADPLVDELLARGYDHAYADYWVAYKLSFESEERVIATGVQHRRGLEDEAAVNSDERPAYVTFLGSPAAERVAGALAAQGIESERVVVGDFWEAHLPLEDVPPEVRTSIYTP